MEILNAAGATIAPAQTLASFQGGVYLKYALEGTVTVRISQLCKGKGDAMLNAIFFD